MGRRKTFIAVFLPCFLLAGAYPALAKESVNDPFYAEAAQAAPAERETLVGEESPGHEGEAHETDAVENEAGEHGGEHGKKGLPQFDPTSFPSQIFWLTVSFIILYAFFSKFTLPQIAQVLKKRRAHIEHDMANAQKMRESAEVARTRFETAVAQAQSELTKLYLKAEQETKAMVAAALEEFKAGAARRVQATEVDIDRAKKEGMESIQTIAAEIASLAAKKIVGVSMDIGEAKTVVRNINRKAA